MAIAIDQAKLRRIADEILQGEQLDRGEVSQVLTIAQLAAGADHDEQPAEHALLQAIAQHILSRIGLKLGELYAIPPLETPEARIEWFRALSAGLKSRAARELAFAMAFLVSIADLELVGSEHECLETLQQALEVDHRRATDLIVMLTEMIAAKAA